MNKEQELKIFYDGECPLCSREIAWLKTRDQKLPVEFVDISQPTFSAEKFGFTKAELMSEMRGLLRDRKLSGMDVFRELYSRVGLGWLLWVTKFPPFRQLADYFYKIFARNRLKLTGRCTIR